MPAMKKVIVFAGTRPEAIKIAPVVAALKAMPDFFETRVCSSGQHRELLAAALADFDIVPDVTLNVMSDNQTLASLSAKLFSAIDAMLEVEKPDAVLVQGDTTTVTVASLCAFYRRIPVGHIEAGLRSFNIHSPFPEELNRRIATLTARWSFAPTQLSQKNLLAEGVLESSIHVTGNTVIDALLHMVNKVRKDPPALPDAVNEAHLAGRRIVLITAHRRENFGAPLLQICAAIGRLASVHPDVVFVYPVHPNPNVGAVVREKLGALPNVLLIDPLPYAPFVRLLDISTLILTDSGGLQEEAPSLGKPVLIMREVTERPEGVHAGVNMLVGTNPDVIFTNVHGLLTDSTAYAAMTTKVSPFGNGTAGSQIAAVLRQDLA